MLVQQANDFLSLDKEFLFLVFVIVLQYSVQHQDSSQGHVMPKRSKKFIPDLREVNVAE